jgi:cytochrome c-type biogenesis protein CcmH/NrfG
MRPPGCHGARADCRRSRQLGAGAVLLLLVVLLIAAVLVGVLLRGGSPGPGAARDPEAAGNPGAATSAPADPRERARALEDTVRQQAADVERRIDEKLDAAR